MCCFKPAVMLLISGAMGMSACAPAPDLAADLSEFRFGWVERGCLIAKTADQFSGERVTLYSQDKSLKTEVVLNAFADAENCPPLMRNPSVAASGEYQFFAMDPNGDYAFGVIPSRAGAGNFEGDLDAAMTQVDYKTCTTGEGINSYIQSQHSGVILWSDYDYLGYDVEVTCPDDLVFP